MYKLKIAFCQFPISNDIKKNATYIKKFMKISASKGADLVHFSESALSGYAGVDFDSFKNFNWICLENETIDIMKKAKELDIWVALGSTHRQRLNMKPRNCVYFISNKGKIVKRYDKCMLTKNDIKYYEAGSVYDISAISIKGIKLGILICYDSCFPKLFEIYKKENVKVLLLSLYNAKNTGKSFLDEITPAIVRTRSVDNEIWIMANNSSAPYSNHPTFIVSPEGRITEKLSRHKKGLLFHKFPDENFKKWKIKYF